MGGKEVWGFLFLRNRSASPVSVWKVSRALVHLSVHRPVWMCKRFYCSSPVEGSGHRVSGRSERSRTGGEQIESVINARAGCRLLFLMIEKSLDGGVMITGGFFVRAVGC